MVYIVSRFSHFCAFYGNLFKMAPKYSDEVLAVWEGYDVPYGEYMHAR